MECFDGMFDGMFDGTFNGMFDGMECSTECSMRAARRWQGKDNLPRTSSRDAVKKDGDDKEKARVLSKLQSDLQKAHLNRCVCRHT